MTILTSIKDLVLDIGETFWSLTRFTLKLPSPGGSNATCIICSIDYLIFEVGWYAFPTLYVIYLLYHSRVVLWSRLCTFFGGYIKNKYIVYLFALLALCLFHSVVCVFLFKTLLSPSTKNFLMLAIHGVDYVQWKSIVAQNCCTHFSFINALFFTWFFWSKVWLGTYGICANIRDIWIWCWLRKKYGRWPWQFGVPIEIWADPSWKWWEERGVKNPKRFRWEEIKRWSFIPTFYIFLKIFAWGLTIGL